MYCTLEKLNKWMRTSIFKDVQTLIETHARCLIGDIVPLIETYARCLIGDIVPFSVAEPDFGSGSGSTFFAYFGSGSCFSSNYHLKMYYNSGNIKKYVLMVVEMSFYSSWLGLQSEFSTVNIYI